MLQANYTGVIVWEWHDELQCFVGWLKISVKNNNKMKFQNTKNKQNLFILFMSPNDNFKEKQQDHGVMKQANNCWIFGKKKKYVNKRSHK